jgi:hypothetical protein
MDDYSDMGKDAGGFTHGCMKLLAAASKARSPHVIFQWQEKGCRFECTVPYMHASCYYTQLDDGTELIRFRGLNDEAMIRGYNLRDVKDHLDNRKLEVLRESPSTGTAREGEQPVILEIRVYDNV